MMGNRHTGSKLYRKSQYDNCIIRNRIFSIYKLFVMNLDVQQAAHPNLLSGSPT